MFTCSAALQKILFVKLITFGGFLLRERSRALIWKLFLEVLMYISALLLSGNVPKKVCVC